MVLPLNSLVWTAIMGVSCPGRLPYFFCTRVFSQVGETAFLVIIAKTSEGETKICWLSLYKQIVQVVVGVSERMLKFDELD